VLWTAVELKIECGYMWEVKNKLFILFDSPSEIVMHCCGWNILLCLCLSPPNKKKLLTVMVQIWWILQF